MESYPHLDLSTTQGKFLDLTHFSKPTIASSFEILPGHIVVVQAQTFSWAYN